MGHLISYDVRICTTRFPLPPESPEEDRFMCMTHVSSLRKWLEGHDNVRLFVVNAAVVQRGTFNAKQPSPPPPTSFPSFDILPSVELDR